jgi:hypothetical protein
MGERHDDGELGEDDDEIKKLIVESLKMKIRTNKSCPSRVRMQRAIIASLSEFLTCFKLIGYDLEGNPINISISSTKLDKSALENLFMQEIGKCFGRD